MYANRNAKRQQGKALVTVPRTLSIVRCLDTTQHIDTLRRNADLVTQAGLVCWESIEQILLEKTTKNEMLLHNRFT